MRNPLNVLKVLWFTIIQSPLGRRKELLFYSFDSYILNGKEGEMKILKVLYQWPLSKVELIEDNGKKILKTIHKDFINEAYRQEFLEKYCKKVKIPQVLFIDQEKSCFIMEYLPTKKEISKETALKLIQEFHEETKNTKSEYFEKYDFERFYQDFKTAKKHLTQYFQKQTKEQTLNFFKEVFDTSYSVAHGDFSINHILEKEGKYYLIDFGKSFFGPSVLDIAHLFLRDTKINGFDKELISKARIVCCIIILRWFELCKEKYIKYDYKKEIEEYHRIIEKKLEGLR